MHGPQNRKNILHVCSENKRHDLLREICLDSQVDIEIIQEAVNNENGDGLTPLDICQDEKTVLDVMDAIYPKFAIDRVDKKGNNVLHIYAYKNFVKCLEKILFSILENRLRTVGSSQITQKFVYELFHTKNTAGENFLSLILQFPEGLLKSIALELEKWCHTKDKKDETKKKIE